MADILYTYKNQVYANITNRCNCNCTFCVRCLKDSVGESDTLWHKSEPTLEEIQKAMDTFDFSGYDELVFCGYGEPTCALENLIASAAYAKNSTNRNSTEYKWTRQSCTTREILYRSLPR